MEKKDLQKLKKKIPFWDKNMILRRRKTKKGHFETKKVDKKTKKKYNKNTTKGQK